MSNSIRVAIAAASTIFFWSSAFIFNKIGLQYLEPATMAFYRYVVGSLVFIPFALLGQIQLPKQIDLMRIFACGFFGVCAYNLMLYNGQITISAGIASLLTNTAPLFTALFSVLFFREKLSAPGWLGMFISTLGVACIVTGRYGNISNDIGGLYALGAAISISVYFIVQRPLYQVYSTLETIAYTIWSGAFILFFFSSHDLYSYTSIPISIHFVVIYLGICPGAIGYLTWAFVSKQMPTAKAAPLLYLIPVSAFILSFYFLDEYPKITTVIGAMITILGVFIVQKFSFVKK